VGKLRTDLIWGTPDPYRQILYECVKPNGVYEVGDQIYYGPHSLGGAKSYWKKVSSRECRKNKTH
jgi:hypothetical protein